MQQQMQEKKKKMQLITYVSIVDESMFASNFISLLLTSRYVDSPCVGVDLLTLYRSTNQQHQQRHKQQLQQPEPAAYGGRWMASSHGFP